MKELAKCVLRCNPCHKAKSLRNYEGMKVPHGGGKKGRDPCKCQLCRDRYNEYMRNWKRQRRALGFKLK